MGIFDQAKEEDAAIRASAANDPEQGPQLPRAEDFNNWNPVDRFKRMQLAASNPSIYSKVFNETELEKADKTQGFMEAAGLNTLQGATGFLLDDMLAATDAAASYIAPQSMMPSMEGADLEGMPLNERFGQSSDYFNELFAQSEQNYPVAAYGGQILGAVKGAPGKAAEGLMGAIRPQGFASKAASVLGIGAAEGAAMGAAEGARGVELLQDAAEGGLLGLGAAPAAAIGRWAGNTFGGKTREALQSLFSREGLKGLERESLAKTGAEDFIAESPRAPDVAAQAISRMNTVDPIEQRRLAELRTTIQADMTQSRGQLETVADTISSVETATQRATRLSNELDTAKGEYDKFIAAHGSTAIPQMELVRAINYAFVPSGQTQDVLSTKANQVRKKWLAQVNDMAERAPNEAIPIKTLLDLRKDISSILSAEDAAELGSAYPKLTATVDSIDDIINKNTNDLYKVVNDRYKEAYKRQEAFDLGSSMFGNKYSADDANAWMQANPNYADEFGYGIRSAMATKLRNGNVRAGLNALLGDEMNPLKVSPEKYKKLSASIGANNAAALKRIYETHGPRVEALNMLDEVIENKLLKPDIIDTDPSTLADRMVVQHALLSGKPLSLAAGRGTAGATSRTLLGANDPTLPVNTTNLGIDLLQQRGGPYRDMMAEMMGRETLPSTQGIAGTVGGVGAANLDIFNQIEIPELDSLLSQDQ